VYGVLLVLAGVVVVSIARLATLLPSYAAEFNALLGSVTAELAGFGVGADQLRALAGTWTTAGWSASSPGSCSG
jgi:AI-2 transport protein TqsA